MNYTHLLVITEESILIFFFILDIVLSGENIASKDQYVAKFRISIEMDVSTV